MHHGAAAAHRPPPERSPERSPERGASSPKSPASKTPSPLARALNSRCSAQRSASRLPERPNLPSARLQIAPDGGRTGNGNGELDRSDHLSA